MQSPLRKCHSCGLEAHSEQDLNLFQYGKTSAFGRRNFCKTCDNARAKTEKAKDPEKWLAAKRNASFLKNYGLTTEQRANYINTIGVCEICNKGVTEKTAHIDHSHTKGHIRGVLCNTCNTGLGKFGDSADLLDKALKYLIEREHMLNVDNDGLDVWKAQIQAVKDKYPKGATE